MGVIAITGTILKAAELVQEIKEILDKVIPPPSKDVTDKFRWYQCTIKNCTQFPLLLEDVYFDTGKWWTAPGSVQPFEQLIFSGCSKDRVPNGVSGGLAFRLKLDQDLSFDIAIGLTSPMTGALKAGVIESLDAKDGYNTATNVGNAITSKNQYRAKNGDNPDQDVDIEFRVSAQPGREMLIVLTQVRL